MQSFSYQRETFRSKILGQEISWGRYRPSSPSAINRTIYLLHGGNGDDRQFSQVQVIERLPSELQAALAESGTQFVLPFIGGSFLHAHPSDPTKAFSRYFFEELLPLAEAETRTTASTRVIAGLSMGGQAALNAFFRKPGLFAAVGAHFPTLIQFNPWDEQQGARYRERLGLDEGVFGVLKKGMLDEFVDVSDFSAHDPLALATQVTGDELRGKRIYFDVGTRDLFGLHEGAGALSVLLSQRGIPHEYHLIENGGHDGDFVVTRFESLVRGVLELGPKASAGASARPRPEAGMTEERT